MQKQQKDDICLEVTGQKEQGHGQLFSQMAGRLRESKLKI